MNSTMLEEALEQAGLPVAVDAFSVYQAFEQFRDGQHRRGQQRPQADACL